MDGHCSRQSIYQTSAGLEHLNFLRLKGLNDSSDEHFKALEPSVRPSELEEHQKRKACLKQDANDRWHRWTENQRARTSEARPLAFPQAKVNNGRVSTHRQPYGKNVDHARPKSRPCPLDLTSEHLWQQHSLGPRREQRGYFEFEIADQKRRVARMGLGGQKAHWEGTMPQTTHPPRIPEPTNHLFSRTCPPKERPVQQKQRQSKAQDQQNQTPACDQRGWERTNAVLLKAGAKQEAGQWNMAQHSLEDQKLAQQRREQLTSEHQTLEPQKVQLPLAKPGNLYPGPTRIPDIMPPIHLVHADSREQSIKSELALSLHLKSKMACQEAYCNYKDKERKKKEGEEQRKATLSIPRYEVTRTESVKQLLASVNKALEQKIEAAEVEVATTNIAECKAFRDQSPEPSKGPEDTYEAGLKCGESFWHKYDRNYPMTRPSHDCPVGVENLARNNGYSRREVSLCSSRTSDLQAAVEAINRTSGDLLGSPNATSDQHASPFPQPLAVSASQDKEENAGLSRTLYDDLSVDIAKQDVAPPSTPQTERTDMSSTSRNHEGGHEDAVEAAPWGEVDIQLEWEEVENSLGDEGWISIEQGFENVVWTESPSSSNLEWASDVASEGAFEL